MKAFFYYVMTKCKDMYKNRTDQHHVFKKVTTFHLSFSTNLEMFLMCLCSDFCLLEFVNAVKL